MKLCVLCGKLQFLVPLSCGCSASCLNCVIATFIREISEQRYRQQPFIACPPDYLHEVSLPEVLETAKGSMHEDTVEEALCAFALRDMTDSIGCVTPGCGYIGWIDATRSEQVQCELCAGKVNAGKHLSICSCLFPQPQYNNPLLLYPNPPISHPLLASAHDSELQATRHSTTCFSAFWCQRCPRCGYYNPKVASTQHCAGCSFWFCWVCQRSAHDHHSGCPDFALVLDGTVLISLCTLLLKVNQVFELVPTADICAAASFVLSFLWMMVCGLATIVLPSLSLLILLLTQFSSSSEVTKAIIAGATDIGFLITVIATGWWKETIAALFAAILLGSQWMLLA